MSPDWINSETLEQLALSFNTSGDNTIIAAPGAGKYLAIDFIAYVPAADVSVTYKSGSNALSGAMPFKANQPIIEENTIHAQSGIITCNDNEAFIMNLSGGVTVTGHMRYRIINK